MGLLIMALNLITNEFEAMIVRQHGKKQCEAGIFFNAVICLFASLFFIISDNNSFVFSKELIPYSIINCILYAGGFYFMYVALSEGSFISTKMLSSSSVIIPIFYGIIFLNETAKPTTYFAIFMMFISVFLQIYEKSGNKSKASLKWGICALMSALCNGFITVIARIQQIRFNSIYDNEYMFFSLLGAFIFLMFFSLIKEHGKIKSNFKHTIFYGTSAGLINGVKNLLNLLILLYFPISVSAPLKLVLGYILSFLISVFLFKERLVKQKLLGIVIGVFSVILFKL